jgi:hypothetical protein
MAVTQFDTYRALNQLASLVVGRDRAIETNDLETDPIARIKKLKLLVDQDFRQANELGDTKTLKQVERTMASLQSLLTLAELAEDIEW